MAIIEHILFKEDGIWKEYDNITLNNSLSKESKRGISFITLKGEQRLINDNVKGFCHNRFKANFVIKDINTNDFKVDQVFKIGDATVKITKVEKECFKDCPIIKNSKMSCNVNKEVFFGEIVEEGLVNKNDKITVKIKD